MTKEEMEKAGNGGGISDQDLNTEPKTGLEAQIEELETKHKVLMGKYNAEVPRSLDRIKYLESLLSTLNTGTPAKGEATLLESTPDMDDFKREYPTIYTGMEKMLGSVQNKINKTLEERFNSFNENTTGQRVQQFQSAMDTRVRDWRNINNDPEFLEWLKIRDKYATFNRHQMLIEAFKAFDVETVASFFDGYVEETKKGRTKDKYVAPDTSKRMSSAGDAGGGKTYTKSQLKQFYTDIATNKLKLTPTELRAEELSIEKAMQEGRIVDE